MFNFLRKKEDAPRESSRKSADIFNWQIARKPSWYAFSNIKCYQYYIESSPLFTAIDRIVPEIESIRPLIFDKRNQVFIDDHPLLDKLKNPNTNLTWSEFVGQFATNFLISGNNFAYATNRPGKIDEPPLEVFIENPQTINILPDPRDGLAGTYQVTDSYNNVKFYRDDLGFRFLDNKNRREAEREIYQTKTFSPYVGQWQRLWGLSRIYPIYFELEQFRESSVHNLSLLEKGGRPSGIIYLDNEVSDKEAQRIQQQVSQAYQGSNNAGRIIVVASNDGKFQEMSINNKDMDFLELKKNITNTIFNIYKIPIPLVSPDTMTLANYTIAQLALYDGAVLPLMSKILQELTDFLMPRYDDSGDLTLAYDPREIPALQERHTQQIINLKNTEALSKNETRALMKLDPVDGGDKVYRSSTLVPIDADDAPATEVIPATNPKPSAQGDENLTVEPKKMFVMAMREYGDFSDTEIEKIWDESVQRD